MGGHDGGWATQRDVAGGGGGWITKNIFVYLVDSVTNAEPKPSSSPRLCCALVEGNNGFRFTQFAVDRKASNVRIQGKQPRASSLMMVVVE